ncbi:hypothetical protein HGRIS_006357 [Hohenbuehelia grisea]|uniref:Superoxide dismutase [Cu-Zn] n=1 Tax=Hohenbuehelia grisea TaxID=104357 RepID=A0ABR3K2I9_9AGAR
MPTNQTQRSLLVSSLAAIAILYFVYVIFFKTSPQTAPLKATLQLSGNSTISGTVSFEQTRKYGPVKVTGLIRNLDPSSKRGFHVHQYGDLSDGCMSTGPHFNPLGKKHGAPTDSDRHVGDLGNIESDENGVASFTFEDSLISLAGEMNIIGRAVVLHAGVDDLGRGDNEESLKTGNAGARAACGIIKPAA